VIAAEAHGDALVGEAGCAEARSAGNAVNLAGKLALRIESKAQLIQTGMPPITSGYRYSSGNAICRIRLVLKHWTCRAVSIAAENPAGRRKTPLLECNA
jgi:hypothetical protein